MLVPNRSIVKPAFRQNVESLFLQGAMVAQKLLISVIHRTYKRGGEGVAPYWTVDLLHL